MEIAGETVRLAEWSISVMSAVLAEMPARGKKKRRRA
jgi:hypothetical protein